MLLRNRADPQHCALSSDGSEDRGLDGAQKDLSELLNQAEGPQPAGHLAGLRFTAHQVKEQ